MSFFPPGVIADIIAMNESAMPDTCAVHHPTAGTLNPDGSRENGTSTITTYACRIAPSGGSPQETLIASRLTDTTPFTIALPWNAVVSETDTIAHQDATYQVLGVLAPTSFMTSVRVVTRRIS